VSDIPIINRVRDLRLQRGDMTQEDLAKLCSVTRQTIIAVESGRYSPSLELAFLLAHALDAGIEDVFEWRPKTRPGNSKRAT
jgi:putative transcriptional regulator